MQLCVCFSVCCAYAHLKLRGKRPATTLTVIIEDISILLFQSQLENVNQKSK